MQQTTRGPRFTPGGDTWSVRRGEHRQDGELDSDTERDSLSNSNSDPSPYQTTDVRMINGDLNGRVQLNASSETLPDPLPIIPYWSAKRHLTCGNPTPKPASLKGTPWRGSVPGKLRTVNAALVLCLNIDVDPPDIIKTNPCAVFECWVDPRTMPSHKALEAIGTNLQHQFEGLSPKIPYKPILDPSFEDLRRFCLTLRKQAKDDSVLFYYNGHGVPKPTSSGELWCFNRNYTQYIPVSLSELQGWLGSPGVYVWDCSAAGNLLTNFNTFADRRDQEMKLSHGGYVDGAQPFMSSLQLAACRANEQLPSCPELPADIFTSCLTSPIDTAMRYFIVNNQLPNKTRPDMIIQIPGDLKDRRTPLGELHWIFTAITDTIAWTSFSRETFSRLYRSDLLIASLFRNFLLAERIMKGHHCTPHTWPPLPPTNTHPMWASWDLALDTCLKQLPDLLNKNQEPAPTPVPVRKDFPRRFGLEAPEKPFTYQNSRFFIDQLTAFEVWISRGGSALTRKGPMSLPLSNGGDGPSEDNGQDYRDVLPEPDRHKDHHLVPRKPPDQLPIVLQVLLSQPHRLRALILLSQFVDLGPWAVHLVLTIGIFPYISKLLLAAGQDLRPVLIFIWTRILAVDPTVQVDLYNTQGYKYFVNVLASHDEGSDSPLPNSSEHKAMCAFILSTVARDFVQGQNACWRDRVFDLCFDRLNDDDFLLRQWSALCISQIWDANDEIKVFGVDRGTQDALIGLLSDDSPEVRCAACYALGTFMGASGAADPSKRGGGGSGTMYQLEERIHFRMEVAVVTGAMLAVKDDASPMVRKELLVLISCLVKEWRGFFVVCAWMYWEGDRKWRNGTIPHPHDEDITNQAVGEWLDGFGDDDNAREESRVLLSSMFTIFVVLLESSVDPYHEVATNAQTIVDYIMALLLESPFAKLDCATLDSPPSLPSDIKPYQHGGTRSRMVSLQPSPTQPPSPIASRPGHPRNDSMTNTISTGAGNTIRRTSSFANALKNLAGNIAFPTLEDGRASPTRTNLQIRTDLRDISRPPSPNLNMAQYTSPYPHPSSPQSVKLNVAPAHPSHPMDFLPSDVMEALMEEDMERLRARRRASTQLRRGRRGMNAVPSPSGSTFSMDSNGSVILGLGTGVGIRDVLPLKSNYYQWCNEYFTEPQMRQTEPDEPGSVQYNYQVWRQQRNERVILETETHAEVAQSNKWDRPVATLHVRGHPMQMTFHSFDQHLVVANEIDMISVWDWSRKKRLSTFCNGNPRGTSITALEIINQDVGGIILTGAADGMVRLYRNYDPTINQGPLQMVSSFRALSEVIQTVRGPGIILDWKQSTGNLAVGGDSRIVRIWDAHTETLVTDLETDSDSPVTAMSTDRGSSSVILAGFADGGIKVFDRRIDDDDAVIQAFEDHTSWVQNVKWHPGIGSQFLSGSLDGEIKLWDLRGSPTPVKTWVSHPNGLSAFDVHPLTPVFAATSAITTTSWNAQRAIVQNFTKSTPLSSLNIPTGLSIHPICLPSSFMPRHSSLVFHPTEMLFGIGEPDGSGERFL